MSEENQEIEKPEGIKEVIKHAQPNNPVHGIKLPEMLKYLEKNLGWEAMGNHIDIRCFTNDPSIGSSLNFLRKTPWAKERVQQLYIQCITNSLPKVTKKPLRVQENVSFVKQLEKRILNKKPRKEG